MVLFVGFGLVVLAGMNSLLEGLVFGDGLMVIRAGVDSMHLQKLNINSVTIYYFY
jgi:hypothetical protein